MYSVSLKAPAKNFIKKLDKSIQKIILKKLRQLENNSKLGKPLLGNLAGLFSLRIGKYRALYQIVEEELVIYVLDLGHRKNIYD